MASTTNRGDKINYIFRVKAIIEITCPLHTIIIIIGQVTRCFVQHVEGGLVAHRYIGDTRYIIYNFHA